MLVPRCRQSISPNLIQLSSSEDLTFRLLRLSMFSIMQFGDRLWRSLNATLKTFFWYYRQQGATNTFWTMEVKVKVARSFPTLCNPTDKTAHGILQVRILEWVAFPFSRRSSQPRDQTLQADSLPAEPQGKPKNTGVGSLSLFQGIFPTLELNPVLLHCRWILYQQSYQGRLFEE